MVSFRYLPIVVICACNDTSSRIRKLSCDGVPEPVGLSYQTRISQRFVFTLSVIYVIRSLQLAICPFHMNRGWLCAGILETRTSYWDHNRIVGLYLSFLPKADQACEGST